MYQKRIFLWFYTWRLWLVSNRREDREDSRVSFFLFRADEKLVLVTKSNSENEDYDESLCNSSLSISLVTSDKSNTTRSIRNYRHIIFDHEEGIEWQLLTALINISSSRTNQLIQNRNSIDKRTLLNRFWRIDGLTHERIMTTIQSNS